MNLTTVGKYVTIDWSTEWANDPEIQLVQGPVAEPLKYWVKEYDPRYLYLGLAGEYAHFYVHDTRNETGFNGKVFNLTMADGSTRSIEGPWQSRASVFNMLMRNAMYHITEVTNAPYRAMRVEWIKAHLPEDVCLVKVVKDGEVKYYASPRPDTNLCAQLMKIKPEICRA